jgi:hypothetical protein
MGQYKINLQNSKLKCNLGKALPKVTCYTINVPVQKGYITFLEAEKKRNNEALMEKLSLNL